MIFEPSNKGESGNPNPNPDSSTLALSVSELLSLQNNNAILYVSFCPYLTLKADQNRPSQYIFDKIKGKVQYATGFKLSLWPAYLYKSSRNVFWWKSFVPLFYWSHI